MLSQRNRLKRADDIASVFRRGKGFHSPFFSAKFASTEGQTDTRLAFSFGKKYLLRAVRRNRLKRMLIGELQKVPDFFNFGIDVVFFLTKSVSLDNKEGLRESVENFVKKVYTEGKPRN